MGAGYGLKVVVIEAQGQGLGFGSIITELDSAKSHWKDPD